MQAAMVCENFAWHTGRRLPGVLGLWDVILHPRLELWGVDTRLLGFVRHSPFSLSGLFGYILGLGHPWVSRK